MIEFRGELSESAKRFILKHNTFLCAIVWSSISVISSSITIAIALIVDIYVLIFLVLFIPIFAVGFIPLKKEVYKLVPTAITIEDNYIYLENNSSGFTRQITQVKKVIDMGDWYHMYFYFPHKKIFFICQKSLLTLGSLEKFEKLFEGKLVRESKD